MHRRRFDSTLTRRIDPTGTGRSTMCRARQAKRFEVNANSRTRSGP
jgi:hypothetical protein